MKARHIAVILVGAVLVTWALASCDLGAVSIDQRISTFQSDLNTPDRANVYQDFHPTMTAVYAALKDPNLSGFNAAYPPPGASYSLSIIDQGNPSTGVIVQVTSGPNSGGGRSAPNYFFKLVMATTNMNDWRIVSIADSNASGGTYTVRFQ